MKKRLIKQPHLSRINRKPAFAYAKPMVQISCAVAMQLISAFVFTTQIVQSLYFLIAKYQDFSHLLWLYSQFVADLVGNLEDRFSIDHL